MTRWLVASTTNVSGGKIEWTIPERPLLHVCCARDNFGALEPPGQVIRLDIRAEVEPDIVADITRPIEGIKDDAFAACFADFPWIEEWRFNSARAIHEMLRIAPVAYTISPWMLGASWAAITDVKVSQRPGINHPILFIRYQRTPSFYSKPDERTPTKEHLADLEATPTPTGAEKA